MSLFRQDQFPHRGLPEPIQGAVMVDLDFDGAIEDRCARHAWGRLCTNVGGFPAGRG